MAEFSDILLVIHLLGLMLGAGGGFGSAVVMAQAARMDDKDARAARSIGPALARLSQLGLVLMLSSGVALMFAKYGGGFAAMPLTFWVKIFFAGTLTIASLAIEFTYRQVKSGNIQAASRLPRLGPMAGISAVLTTVFAVLTFH